MKNLMKAFIKELSFIISLIKHFCIVCEIKINFSLFVHMYFIQTLSLSNFGHMSIFNVMSCYFILKKHGPIIIAIKLILNFLTVKICPC